MRLPMQSHWLNGFLCALALATASSADAQTNPFIGANLNGIADFRRNHEFVDVLRQARRFGTADDPFNTVIALGADGWPTGDFGVTLMAAQTGVLGLDGAYKVIFNGQANVQAVGGTTTNLVYTAGTNTTTLDFNFLAANETGALRFRNVPAGNPVKNLRVIRPGFSTTSPPTFTPAYLSHVSRFSVLRFMDWLSTNDQANSIISWADRPTLEKKRTEAEGARWEAVIELANATNRDIWINIPVRANDEYVTNLATQLQAGLNPAINVYVEYSNELWNAAFPQFAIQKQLAIDEVNANAASVLRYDGSIDQNVWAFRRVAKRLKEISNIFSTVWGAPAINTRIRPVLAGQMANSFIVTEGINLIDAGFNIRPNTVFYAISGAPYIFPSANNQASDDETQGLTSTQILTAIGNGVTNAPNASSYQYESHLGLAAWHNLKVLAYEGGFDTFGSENIAAKRDANLDPQIRVHCRNLINTWHAFGFESFVYFNAGADSYNIPFGQWPLLEDMQSTVFPKNQCMDDVLNAAVPALTAGVPITAPVAGGAFSGSAAPGGTISNVSGPFGFPGFAQFLLRVETAGTYELRFTSTGSDTPKVGVQLNGATINSAFLLPQSASFTTSNPITLTLRRGINALRLTRPPAASTWTIQSLGFTQVAPAFALNAVVSRKTDAGVDRDITVDSAITLGGSVTVEPRVIGSAHKVVFQFNGPVTSVGSVSTTAGSATSLMTGNDVVVTLTGVAGNSRAMLTLNGVNGAGPFTASLGFLVGDVNNTRSVNASDISGVKARSGQVVDAANFKFDLNVTGSINASDISAVKARSGLALPP